MKDVGGAESFFTLNSELLFALGDIVGLCTLATAIVSRRLCPGTPSNVPLSLSEIERRIPRAGVVGGATPSLSAAARVIRGAIVGAAVDATEIVVERLWPGTSMNVCLCCSFVGITRGRSSLARIGSVPARSAAARVVRGAMSGASFVLGTGRALKPGFPAPLAFPLEKPFEEAVFRDPGELVRCKDWESWEDDGDRGASPLR